MKLVTVVSSYFAAVMVMAAAVDVYVTSGDQQTLLEKQPSIYFEQCDASLSGCSFLPASTIYIDEYVTYQSIVGFGAHMTESSAYNLMRLSSSARTDVLTKLFTSSGARLSVVGLTIGASDFSSNSYSYADTKGPSYNPLQYFSIARDRNYVIPVLKAVKAIQPEITIVAKPWSPPAWMKDSGSVNGGNLLRDYFTVYADYLVATVKAYYAEGLPINYLSLINEPQHSTWGYPTTIMTVSDQIDLLKLVRAALDACTSCGSVALLAYEHNWDTPEYPVAVLSDPSAKAAVVGTAWHCYGGDVSQQSYVQSKFPEKGVFITECTGGGWATSFSANLSWNMRNLLIGGVRNWAKTSLMWNFALDESFGPINGGCTNCRGVVTVKASGTVAYNVDYYGMAHMSKFLDKGAVRIKSSGASAYGDGSKGQYLHSAAFKNPDGSVVVVVLNEGWNTVSDVKVKYRTGLLTLPNLKPESVATFVIPP